MKKSRTSFIVLFMMAIALLFASCQAESDPYDDSTSTSTQTGGSSSGGSTGSSTGGSSSTGLWSKFAGCDLQIWLNTFTAETGDDGIAITVGSAGWWGGCFCNKGSVGATDSGVVKYDMSKVAKITFDAKGSAAGAFYICNSDSAAQKKGGATIPLTTAWVSQTYSCSTSVSATDYGLFDVIGASDAGTNTTTTAGYIVYIKNVAFWDASNNEIVPTEVN